MIQLPHQTNDLLKILREPAFLAPAALALIGAFLRYVVRPTWMYVHGVLRSVEFIRAELAPDHGNSLRDSVNRIEAEVAHLGQRWLAASNLFPLGIWEASDEGSVAYVSRQFTVWTGRRGDELLGNGWLGMVHPDDRERVMEEWGDAVKQHRFYDNHHRYLAADEQSSFPVHVRAYPIKSQDGQYYGHIGIVIREDHEECGVFTHCPALAAYRAELNASTA
jgi:PAS domain S-box-containing protein